MTIRLNPRWLLVSALVFSLQFCRAQTEIPPSLSFELGANVAPETQVWDLNGSYNATFEIIARNGLAMPVNISFALAHDKTGKLSAPNGAVSGIIFNNDANSAFAITTTVSGKVTGSGGFARAHFTVHFSGNGSFGGRQNLSVSGSMTVDAETDPSSGLLTGAIKNFHAAIDGVNNISGKSDFNATLPSDGSWGLQMNIAGLTKFTGTSTITFPSNPYGLNLDGNFRNGLINLKATGTSGVVDTQPGQGLSAKIFLTQTFDTLQFDGKLFGQKVSFNVATTPEE